MTTTITALQSFVLEPSRPVHIASENPGLGPLEVFSQEAVARFAEVLDKPRMVTEFMHAGGYYSCKRRADEEMGRRLRGDEGANSQHTEWLHDCLFDVGVVGMVSEHVLDMRGLPSECAHSPYIAFHGFEDPDDAVKCLELLAIY